MFRCSALRSAPCLAHGPPASLLEWNWTQDVFGKDEQQAQRRGWAVYTHPFFPGFSRHPLKAALDCLSLTIRDLCANFSHGLFLKTVHWPALLAENPSFCYSSESIQTITSELARIDSQAKSYTLCHSSWAYTCLPIVSWLFFPLPHFKGHLVVNSWSD